MNEIPEANLSLDDQRKEDFNQKLSRFYMLAAVIETIVLIIFGAAAYFWYHKPIVETQQAQIAQLMVDLDQWKSGQIVPPPAAGIEEFDEDCFGRPDGAVCGFDQVLSKQLVCLAGECKTRTTESNEPVTLDQAPDNNVVDSQISYINNQYAFSFSFPESWAGYTVANRLNSNHDGAFPLATYVFGFSAQPDLFTLKVWTESEWQEYIAAEPERAQWIKIGENQERGMIYSFESAQYAANREMSDRFSELGAVRSSFMAGQP